MKTTAENFNHRAAPESASAVTAAVLLVLPAYSYIYEVSSCIVPGNLL